MLFRSVYRDPSAWYHVVVALDTTNATAQNRLRAYINGVEVTSWATNATITQNTNYGVNITQEHDLGRRPQGTPGYYDGYMTNVYFVDGQQLTPASFGNTDQYGNWKPIAYTGSYGANGFYLKFNNAASTTTIGYDSSPNGNNWTANNISVTPGTTYDSMFDVPTNTSATVANYCILNPLPGPQAANIGLITNGNLSIANNAGATNMFGFGSISMDSGKFYWEVTITGMPTANTSTMCIGICGQPYADATMRGYYNNGNYWTGSSSISYGATYTTNDLIGVAFDATNQTIEFFKNGTSQGQKTSIATSGTNEFAWVLSTSTPGAVSFNFGQRPFAYTPPSGYVALNTYNLPTPTIQQGNLYMDATLYTGTGVAGNVIVNSAGFQPDLVWMKDRTTSTTRNNFLFDSVRGTSAAIYSNLADAQATSSGVTSFNSNGFTVGNNGNGNAVNDSYVGWQWKANNSSVTNTAGTLTTTVNANTTAGFSVLAFTYGGNGVASTAGHGLGATPTFIITKGLSLNSDWIVYHKYLNATPQNYGIVLNSAGTPIATSTYWNNTAPTSTVFSVGSQGNTNANAGGQIFYCFTDIVGFSKFGSYTGNGNADGTFVYLGFRPAFVLLKNINTTDSWLIKDYQRASNYNPASGNLYPNLNIAEDTGSGAYIDLLSNGFKIRGANISTNGNGNTIIYAAFAQNPFNNANAR